METTMNATATAVTPDTAVYTLTAEFAGYTLHDSILGNLTHEQYASASNEKDPITGNFVRSENDSINALCDWLSEMIGQGFWLSESDARSRLDEMDEAGERTTAKTITRFTPAGIHAEIMRVAAESAE